MNLEGNMPPHFRSTRAVLLILLLVTSLAPPVRGQRPVPDNNPTALLTAPDLWLQLPDVTLRYRIIGRGEPVILLHGYTDRIEMWRGIADSLAAGFQVVALDLRGFGASTKFAGVESYDLELMDDVARLMDHLGFSRAHIVGYSMGAMIAAKLAVRRPELVQSLTLVGGPLLPDSLTSARRFEPYAQALEAGEGIRPLMGWVFPTWSDSALDQMNEEMLAIHDLGSLIAVVRALPSLVVHPSDPPVGRFPTLAIVGTLDPMLPYSRALAEWWPTVRVVEVPGSDHADIIDHPSLLAELRSLATQSRAEVRLRVPREGRAPKDQRPMVGRGR
jgi:pimeloyl-ACP methyl ester carboxylesterase